MIAIILWVTSTIEIIIATNPMLDTIVNRFDVFPVGGTQVNTISWKKAAGSYDTVSPYSKFPVQLIGTYQYDNELRLVLKGVKTTDGYYYALRYIHVFECDFLTSGNATYNIGEWSNISDIQVNDDYITENLKLQKPIRIEITSDDTSIVYYDSDTSEESFPLRQDFSIPGGPLPLKMKVTLRLTEGVTPVIKYINIEGE